MLVEHSQICSALNKDSFRFSRFQDFAFSETKVLDIDKIAIDNYMPYCIDVKSGRILFTDFSEKMLNSAFFYQAQRRMARYAISMALDDFTSYFSERTRAERFPVVMLFSIGRCGSTLASKIIATTDTISISEPDVFLSLRVARRRFRLPGLEHALVNALTSHPSFKGSRILIKLRSTAIDSLRFYTSDKRRYSLVFLTRSLLPWARSFMLKFAKTPEKLIEELKVAREVIQSESLKGTEIRYFDYQRIASNPIEFASVISSSNLSAIQQKKIIELMSIDSQLDSGIFQREWNHSEIDAQLERFESLLRSPENLGLEEFFTNLSAD